MASANDTTSAEPQVTQILADVEATFSRPDEVIPAINQASTALQDLLPITEADRVHVLVGFVRLLDMLIDPMRRFVDGAEPTRWQYWIASGTPRTHRTKDMSLLLTR